MRTSGGGTDYGSGLLTLSADGSAQLKLTSKKTPGSDGGAIGGRIDSAGNVLIVSNENGLMQRWDARFSLQPATGGGSRPVGGGRYESRLSSNQGQRSIRPAR